MDREEIKLITKICYMYYYEDEVQAKIAKRFNITRQMVSRLMQKAKDEGILKIIIESPVEALSGLEAQLEAKFGFKDAVVIQNDTVTEEDLVVKLGKAAGEYLNKVLKPKLNIGIGFGPSIESMAESIRSSAAPKGYPDISLIQLTGGVNSGNSYDNSQYILNLMSKGLGGSIFYLNAPLMIEDKTVRDSVTNSSIYSTLLDSVESMDYAFVQVNPATRVYRPYELELTSAGINYLNMLGISYLNNLDAAGEVCLNYFNDRGHFIETSIDDQLVTIPHKKFREIKNLVGIVGGEHSHEAALGVVRSKMLDVIVTDEDTARMLLANS